MMRILIAAAVAASAILPVAAAAPASASNALQINVDPRDWEWTGTITINYPGGWWWDRPEDSEITRKSFTVEPGSGIQNIFVWDVDYQKDYKVYLMNNTLTGPDGVTRKGDDVGVQVSAGLVYGVNQNLQDTQRHDVPVTFSFGEPGGLYELKFYPGVWAQSPQNVTSAGDLTVSQTDVKVPAMSRSKNTGGYVTDQPNRVTAMAKRFVAEPGSPINIHGYGPDKQVALARAEHVRDHLISEIARLGGDPADYPTFVVYAGNPDHKKGVHVTIHQHDASSIAIR